MYGASQEIHRGRECRFRGFAIDAMLDASAAMGMRLAGWPAARREREIERL
jgi:hypothetical protein